MKKTKESFLIVTDLDGTLLKNSETSEISQEDIKAIHRAIAAGHVVCIATGRPWRSTKKAYETLGLDSVVANYNGAQIHNPSDYDFNSTVSYLNLNDVMYILGDKKIKEAASNVAIEGPGWVMAERSDDALNKVFGFSEAKRFKEGLDFHRLPLKPTGVIIDTKKDTNILELKHYLQRTYGDLAEFSSWSKGEGLTPVVDITAVGVTKGKVLPLLSRYYKIPMTNSIAIGDGYNDIAMFEMAEFSVAMANSNADIQNAALCTTAKTNKENGVASFLNQFLDSLEGDMKFIQELRQKRAKNRNLRDNTVALSE